MNCAHLRTLRTFAHFVHFVRVLNCARTRTQPLRGVRMCACAQLRFRDMPKTEWEHLRKTARWLRLRVRQLSNEPMCRLCRALGKRTAATVCDHIKPHKGDVDLFYDPDNLQSLCKECHDGAKAELERSGKLRGCDANGNPIDANHHWNK